MIQSLKRITVSLISSPGKYLCDILQSEIEQHISLESIYMK